MTEKHEKNDLFLISIVALVAIVGIVIMISAANSGSLSSDDAAGQASKIAVSTPSTRGYCIDDGVLNYYSRDTVVYSDGRKETVYTDFCINYNGTLREYYCNKGKVAYKSPLPSECPQGCLNGACINVSAVCGNGVVEPGEQCDDGNNMNTDTCNTLCQLTRCGDAIIQNPNGNGFNEQCDDGNTNNNDTCYNNCTLNQVTPTCTDTDGGLNLFYAGTVYGTSTNGIIYAYHDACISTTQLREYWCTSNLPVNYTINCTCSNAACVNQTGSVNVISNPTAANVYIDQVYSGVSPLTVSGLSLNTHTYRLSKAGYIDATGNFVVAFGQPTYLNITLNPASAPSADLLAEDILFISPYGNVTLNNSIGQGTPFYIVPRVKNMGNVSVYANSFYNRITFGSAYGTFSNYIRCSTSNNWPIAPGASFNCASDNIIRNLTVGTYPISIGVDYYNNISESNENNNARTEVVYIVAK